jgi:hypothetical protein
VNAERGIWPVNPVKHSGAFGPQTVSVCIIYNSHNKQRTVSLNAVLHLGFLMEALCFLRGKNRISKYSLEEIKIQTVMLDKLENVRNGDDQEEEDSSDL